MKDLSKTIKCAILVMLVASASMKKTKKPVVQLTLIDCALYCTSQDILLMHRNNCLRCLI